MTMPPSQQPWQDYPVPLLSLEETENSKILHRTVSSCFQFSFLASDISVFTSRPLTVIKPKLAQNEHQKHGCSIHSLLQQIFK